MLCRRTSLVFRSLLVWRLLGGLIVMASLSSVFAAEKPKPVIVAHRGASGTLPEHTLPAYELAIELGADYVEPDVVATKDGVLICRHECELGATTNAPQKFPEKKRKLVIDGVESEGWFAEDFTLAEVKTLRARQAFDFRNHEFDGKYEVPTLEEMIACVQQKAAAAGRKVGIYPETKHPTHHQQIGLALERPLVKILNKYGYRDRDDLCVVQSFEIANLKQLATMTKVHLVQLMEEAHKQPGDVVAAGGTLTYGQMMRPAGLREIAKYATTIGPWKESILPRDKNNHLGQPNALIADAHAAGLAVVPYTFRNEPQFLAVEYAGDPKAEFRRWFEMGVDGLFTDFPGTAVELRRELDHRQ
jgi:glycerophosphoryl diester phosphodiesterase